MDAAIIVAGKTYNDLEMKKVIGSLPSFSSVIYVVSTMLLVKWPFGICSHICRAVFLEPIEPNNGCCSNADVPLIFFHDIVSLEQQLAL